ncbi:MAG: spermidine/putrescine ABC transporter substrate-binding protein, partial [Enterococcus aquimarinus]
MKKLQSLIIGILLIILVTFLGVKQLERSTGMAGAQVVNIYNWGDYIDPELLKDFEKEFG